MVAFTQLLLVLTCVALANAIPMSFRKEIPADETPIAMFRDSEDNKDYRLPNNTIPLRYDIWLSTDVDKAGQAEFSGKVQITIQVLEASNQITLHSRQQTIVRIDLLNESRNPIQSDIEFTKNEDVEFLNIPLTSPLDITLTYILDITYTGLLRDDNLGFYRSSYKNASGDTVWIATTQFEETDARHAFPCYDEPHLRAVFSISITHHKSYNAISNWPVISVTPSETASENYVDTKFQDTERVQTYLIAFIVSDFKSIENTAAKKQRVFAKPKSIEDGEAALALDAGQKLLDKFVEHLGVEYSPPKMDQVAVPDFDAGAMENWGLVTYREEYLLYNPTLATTRQRENILTIISHEYAHQWFGNHVSPKWWSYLWMNEGFATLYENYLASLVYTDDRLMDTFVVDVVQSVLDVDANPAIRPMTYYVEKPERIADLFDRVAYDKSGSVLRMMQVALGVDTWTKGLKNYLNTMKFKSASSDDLYAGLQTAVNEAYPSSPPNVATIMRSWENQAGYPVVTVSRNGGQLNFTQERFHYTNDSSNSLWWVPINYVVGSNPNFTHTNPDTWIPATRTLTISNETASKKWTSEDWVVVNIQESSYFRVNYDSDLWSRLIQQLNGNGFDKIHLLNRAQLVDDSLNLARAGRIDYDVAFEILQYLTREMDYIPWASANRGMTLLNRWLTGSSAYANYQKFVRKIVAPLFTKFGVQIIDNEPKLDRYARQIATNLACEAGLEACLVQTAAKLQELVIDAANIHPDLQSAIYCNGLRQGNATTFNFLREKMLASQDQAERTLIIAALGCSGDSALLTNYLSLTLQSGDSLRLQEKFRVLAAPMNNGELGLQVMMQFIENNYAGVNALKQVDTMLGNIAPRVASQKIYDDFNKTLTFLVGANHLTEESANAYRVRANSNLEWQDKHLQKIGNWLDDTEDTTTTTTASATSKVISTIAITSCALIKYFI